MNSCCSLWAASHFSLSLGPEAVFPVNWASPSNPGLGDSQPLWPYQGSHKNLKTEFHDFSMTDLLLSMTAILTWFQIWLWLFHDMHDNHKLESCYSHENKQFHDFSMTFWEIFTFQDFSMTFHDSNFFQDFLWPWEPCLWWQLLKLWSAELQPFNHLLEPRQTEPQPLPQPQPLPPSIPEQLSWLQCPPTQWSLSSPTLELFVQVPLQEVLQATSLAGLYPAGPLQPELLLLR